MRIYEGFLHAPHEEMKLLATGLVLLDQHTYAPTIDTLRELYEHATDASESPFEPTYELELSNHAIIRALGKAAEELAWLAWEVGPKFGLSLRSSSTELFTQFVELYANNSCLYPD